MRGESIIASLGISTSVIILAMMGAAAWWQLRAQNQALERSRYDEVRAISSLLARSAETLLASDDLSGLRRTIVDASRDAGLVECRVKLPDGRIVADATPARINVTSLPAHWPSGPLDVPPVSEPSGPIRLTQSLAVPGRGAAILELTAAPARVFADWDAQAIAGSICIAGLGALLLVYRKIRSRVLTLGLIRESLHAIHNGESARDALQISASAGPEASAWNRLLDEREHIRRQALSEEACAAISHPAGAEAEIENACNSLSLGMVILDEHVKVRHLNGAAASLLQIRRDEAVSRDLPSLVTDPTLKEAMAGAVQGVPVQRRTLEITRGEGEAQSVLRVHVRPLRRDDGSGALMTIEDVTQQRVAEASRNSFVTQATHELRTPLTNMRLCLETALENANADAAFAGKCFNQINHEVRRLERTVSEMLSFAEIEAGCLQLANDDVRLDNLFDELRGKFEPQASSKNITLTLDLPPKLPVIQADRDKLVLALHNLVGNALKYTPENGRVTVAVHEVDGQLTVDVSDTGIGIRDEEQERVFERFYRAKDPRVAKSTGSGLGLALTREVARLHGGDVTVQSELDKGSTFTFTVPARATVG
jgi:signal transduction histidine kinase